MKKITKSGISITIDKNIIQAMNEDISNKSKYIEWLIYQDMMLKSKNEKLKKILI